MSFYNSLLAALKALALSVAALVAMLVGTSGANVSYAPQPAAPQAVTVLPATTTPAAVAPASASSSSKEGPAVIKPATAASTVHQTSPLAPTKSAAPPPAFTDASGQAVNLAARSALVNVLCTTGGGGYFNPISGSGVFIDTRGVILTNAHVGQFFLLRDYGHSDNVQCVIRTGSPAQPTYVAELLYLPPSWIAANASKINTSDPTGTGQYDYALLLVTGPAGPGGALPSPFPALPMTLDTPIAGEEVLLAAYPAGLLGGTTIQENLYQSSAFSTVGTLYSYTAAQHVDLFSLSGSVVSQSGSSGGAVIEPSGSLLGIIATAAVGTTTQRELNAITLGHIDRSLRADGLGGIEPFLQQPDLAQVAADFAKNTAPVETAALEAYLPKP